jgi:16S rRNA (cytosine967-C5)-methyltransferase
MSKIDKSLSSQSWQASVRVVEDFLKSSHKLDTLLERNTRNLESNISKRAQYLSYGVIRHLGRLQALLQSAVKKRPKKKLQAIMLVSLFEWLEADEETRPRVVHHSVERAKSMLSKPESRFANAVLRRIQELRGDDPSEAKSPDAFSRLFSHPQWMVDRWIVNWGEAATKKFLQWNQSTPKVFAHCAGFEMEVPDNWKKTAWANFYEINEADWEVTRTWLSEGRAYIQDPSTRLGCELLEGQSFKTALDLCSAPGGKSVQLLQKITGPGGLLVSVDVPGLRYQRLQENLARYEQPNIEKVQVAADVLELTAKELPQAEYDIVYVDVPCSNTGVIQRRPDVKWRLQETSMIELTTLQGSLLKKAAEFVAPGGALIYSTCSVDTDENRGVVNAFMLNTQDRFQLEKESISLPWQSGHDGAGAFLLRRTK